MCVLCVAGGESTADIAQRLYVLRLLALVEHPDALPHDAALRLSREMMVMLGPARATLRCDPIPPNEAIGVEP